MQAPEPVLLLHAAQAALAARVPALLVSVVASRGSVPRVAGAAMLVQGDCVVGTVGGGHLEFVAIMLARRQLSEAVTLPVAAFEQAYPLGAALGQCCGGAMTLRFEPLQAQHLSLWQTEIAAFKTLFLFGAGHVARALVPMLAPLPLRVVWADAREAVNTHQTAFPSDLPPHISTVVSDTLEAELDAAQTGDMALIMTHSHAIDEALVQAALRTPQLAYIGLIGSATKRRLFQQRLSQRGQRGFGVADFARLTCPIGLASANTAVSSAATISPRSKLPAVIATAVAAQLLAYL